MWRDLEGGVYWDEFAEACGNFLRVAGIRGVVRFRGNRYVHSCDYSILEMSSARFD